MRAGAFGLSHGLNLILYPEGERSIDGTPRTFKKGAAILSVHMQVPIVPIAIDGFHDASPGGTVRLRPSGAPLVDYPIVPKLWEAFRTAQKKLAAHIQVEAYSNNVPYVPTGQFVAPTAYRKDLDGIIVAPVVFLWNVEKK